MPVFGGGKSPELAAAADAYMRFLFALAKGESDRNGLVRMLDEADVLLNVAFEEARKREGGTQA